MAIEFRDKLKGAAAAVGVAMTDAQAEAFVKYKGLLASANRTINLTAIPEDRYLEDHFIDSLTLLQVGKVKNGQEIADIGTGAGFPGVPIKIIYPGVKLHLMEANAKKAEFLRRLTEDLAMEEVFVDQLRAEEAGRRPEFRGKMDIVVARAVAALPVLLEYALPLCQVGGWFLGLKGPKVDQEMAGAGQAALELGGRLDSNYSPYGRPASTKRVIVLVEKVAATGEKYPRRVGLPAKRPLGG